MGRVQGKVCKNGKRREEREIEVGIEGEGEKEGAFNRVEGS